MRCRKCGARAVINMQQHRLSLCKNHFLDWLIDLTERNIQKYEMFTSSERVLLAVSGGKDSLALWDILWYLDYQPDGLFINLGINGENNYSGQSQKFARFFADERKLVLHVFDIKKETGKSIDDLYQNNNRGREKPCSVCGLVKRHMMNRFSKDNGYDVLVTAHNLDDEAALLLSNTLSWSINFLARGFPFLPAKPGFTRKVKLFFRIYERESAAYAILREIKYIEEECPYSRNSKQLIFKEHLNDLEESMPGTKLRFYLNYLKDLDNGAFPDQQENEQNLARKICMKCGQLTIMEGMCSYCKLVR